jgi:protein-S-isoprenylcysteine O-methyltransferase Ste14
MLPAYAYLVLAAGWLIWVAPFLMVRRGGPRPKGQVDRRARTLGRQWRIDAGLNADHELVMAGPYAWVRHPIYTSMLCLSLGTGFMLAPLLLLALSLVVFMAGTQIRVRIEDKLLASRFGDPFREYQRRVPAYVPFT